jgi:hypothetical protein
MKIDAVAGDAFQALLFIPGIHAFL